jgi:hypothetical protein
LLGPAVAKGVALDEPALDAAGLETGALEETAGKAEEAEEARPLALAGALGSVPSGAAWWR